jgi:hypothetical protein
LLICQSGDTEVILGKAKPPLSRRFMTRKAMFTKERQLVLGQLALRGLGLQELLVRGQLAQLLHQGLVELERQQLVHLELARQLVGPYLVELLDPVELVLVDLLVAYFVSFLFLYTTYTLP